MLPRVGGLFRGHENVILPTLFGVFQDQKHWRLGIDSGTVERRHGSKIIRTFFQPMSWRMAVFHYFRKKGNKIIDSRLSWSIIRIALASEIRTDDS